MYLMTHIEFKAKIDKYRVLVLEPFLQVCFLLNLIKLNSRTNIEILASYTNYVYWVFISSNEYILTNFFFKLNKIYSSIV